MVPFNCTCYLKHPRRMAVWFITTTTSMTSISTTSFPTRASASAFPNGALLQHLLHHISSAVTHLSTVPTSSSFNATRLRTTVSTNGLPPSSLIRNLLPHTSLSLERVAHRYILDRHLPPNFMFPTAVWLCTPARRLSGSDTSYTLMGLVSHYYHH